MRVLVQRVSRASVTVAGQTVGQIGHGLLLFLGIHHQDTAEPIPWLAKRVSGLRIFPDDQDKMNRSVEDVDGGVLVVSQFTLYGTCDKGRRPEFTQAASGDHAEMLYDQFVAELCQLLPDVKTGEFGAKMEVELINDGPVTLLIERN